MTCRVADFGGGFSSGFKRSGGLGMLHDAGRGERSGISIGEILLGVSGRNQDRGVWVKF